MEILTPILILGILGAVFGVLLGIAAKVFRVSKDERIEKILFSHAYEPWYKDSIFGREKVLDILSKCTEYV